MSRLDEYQTFVAIVEHGSLAAAARTLHLSPSAVSKQLSQLETRLGITLLDRSTRSQSITTPGRTFYEECRQILNAVSDAEERLALSQNAPAGKLHLSCPRILMQPGFFQLLNQFRDAYPGIKLDIAVSDSEQDLVGGRLDAAIRIGAPGDSRLQSLTLGETRALFCCSPQYLQHHGHPETLSGLREHNVILPTYINLSEKMKLMFDRQARVDLADYDTADDALAIIGRVREGGGIAMLLDVLAGPDLASGTLVNLFPALSFPAQPITLLWSQHRQRDEKLKLLKQFIREHFAPLVMLNHRR